MLDFLKIRRVYKELRGLRLACERIADCLEADLAERGYNIRPPKADTSGPEPTLSYVAEDEDWARETIEHLKRREQAEAEAAREVE